jgi:hypothetical protein
MRRHQRRRDHCAPMLFTSSLLAAMLAMHASGQETWYVDAHAQGSGTGEDWANAWTDLQSALTSLSVEEDDVIWVADGTYKPTEGITFPQGEEREQSFIVKTNRSVYGGFLGGAKKGMSMLCRKAG